MSDISFASIPSNWYVPGVYVEVDNTRANKNPSDLPKKHLVVGQKLAAGSATANAPIYCASADQAATLTGRGSQLHQMVKALRQTDPYGEIYLLPLTDNAAGTQSTRTLTVTGPATAAGTLVCYIGGRRYTVGVASGDSAATIATAISAAVAADAEAFVTAAVAAAVTTLTAKHKGIDAGDISAVLNRYAGELLPAGVGVTIGALTAGTGNPDVTAGLAALGDTWFTQWTLGVSDAANLTLIETELETRYGPITQLEAIAFCAATKALLSDALALHTGRNSPHLAIFDTADTLSPAWLSAAAASGAESLESDPGRPRQTLALTGIVSKSEAGRRTDTDRNQLVAEGISTLKVDSGGVVRINYITMCYRTNAQGMSDDSYFDVEGMELIRMFRYTYRDRMSSRYPRYKLGQDGSIGPNVFTPSMALSEGISLYDYWMSKGWVEGGDARDQFISDQRAEIDSDNPNRLNHLLPPDTINQLRVTAALLQFRR